MSNHTPTPWRVETDTATPLVVNSEGWPILISGGVREIGVSYDENRKRLIADVHLAAAAPEMLLALKDLLDGMLAHGAEKWFPHRIERAQAAIAKAEGR